MMLLLATDIFQGEATEVLRLGNQPSASLENFLKLAHVGITCRANGRCMVGLCHTFWAAHLNE